MTKLQAKPDNYPWISPYLMVRNIDESLKFYNKAFGFEAITEETAKNEKGVPIHAAVRYKDTLFMMGLEGAYDKENLSPLSKGSKSPISLYVYCDDVDKLFKQAKQAGAKVDREPENSFWGDRMCSLFDQDGYNWCFATKINV